MKRRIRLTENDLHRIIKESVKRVLNEDINNEIWFAVYVASAEDLNAMDDIYSENDGPCFVELTLVKSTDEEKAGRAGAWKLEDRYRCGKLVPVCVRVATKTDFDLWKQRNTHFTYEEFERII